ncbi:hypothetical protein S83_007303 [Arachis hypogaea]
MDLGLKRFFFFVVTKGHCPGVYTSWEEANEQVTNFSFPEYQGFNSYEHACICFKARMCSLSWEKASCGEFVGAIGEGASGHNDNLSNERSRRGAVVSWLPVIPEEELNLDFAVVANMEDWLVKVCHDAQIPSPCFFKQERFTREKGPFYGFTVVVPGNPFEVELSARGRFSLVEKAAREDAAFEMLGRVLDLTGKEIRDYSYSKLKLVNDSNNALRAKVSQLEEAYEKLRGRYDALKHENVEGNAI